MNKIKILLWSDAPAPICWTGYGTVCKNIFLPLYKTGKFDIDQIAINYHGDFYDKSECPWQLSPARLLDPSDPYGTQMFLKAVQKNDYDIIWIINDSFIPAKAVEPLKQIFENKRRENKPIPKIVYYYPVDVRLKKEHLAMIEFADQPVCYAKFGFDETIKLLPHLKNKLRIIHHGCNTSKYFPYSKEIITKLKKEDESQIKVLDYYNIFDGDAYRFRPRGFLYIVGRKQYFQLYEEFNKSGEVSIESPFRLSDSVDSAIQTSIVQWKYFKGLKGNNPQTSYFYTSQKNNGTLATYKKCLDTAHQFSPPKSDKSIETFQNVLTIFVGKDGQPLIDYFKPA